VAQIVEPLPRQAAPLEVDLQIAGATASSAVDVGAGPMIDVAETRCTGCEHRDVVLDKPTVRPAA